MDILENRDQWLEEFEAGWSKHFKKTGEKNWKIYNLPRNSSAPAGPGIDLSKSRLALISSAGGYLEDEQIPFDDKDPYGDYSIRTFPVKTPPEKIAFSHPAYDKTNVDKDQQVLLPLTHLQDMVVEGVIGELAPRVISFMGYQPVVTKLIDETFPKILQAVEVMSVNAVLLVPS